VLQQVPLGHKVKIFWNLIVYPQLCCEVMNCVVAKVVRYKSGPDLMSYLINPD
jgi:hypothetical protein